MPLDVWSATLPTGPVAPPSSPSPAPGSGSVLTTFQITSQGTGTEPFTIGVALPPGLTQGPVSTDITNSQAVIMRRYNDGSIKHVIIAGLPQVTAGVPLTVKVLDAPSLGGGANLTAADIAAALAAPNQNVVSLGAFGGVDLSGLLAAPTLTFWNGPQAVHCIYETVVPVAGASGIFVAFHVKLFKGGRVWVRTVVDRGVVEDAPAAGSISYAASVTIGGVQLYSGSITHYLHTRPIVVDGWIGGDPQITPTHNVIDLLDAKLVPNYFMDTPSAAALNNLTQTYAPMSQGDWDTTFGATGDSAQIGWLPNWDALFITSRADSRAYNSVVANAKAIGTYPIVWRGANDNRLPCRPSIYPSWSTGGNFQGPDTTYLTVGTLTYDIPHHGSAGYLAYILTGDYLHLETMQHQAASCYLLISSLQGTGTSRNMANGQVRGAAWQMRTITQLAAIAPTSDPVVIDYTAGIRNTINLYLLPRLPANTPTNTHTGIIVEYDTFGANGGADDTPLFMHKFFVWAIGQGSDLVPLADADMVNYRTVRDWIYNIPVKLFGTGTGTDFCYQWGGTFKVPLYPLGGLPPTLPAQAPSPTDFTAGGGQSQLFDNWNQIWNQAVTNGLTASTTCTLGSALTDGLGVTNGIAYSLGALSLAVDHGASGATASYTRLISASNWLPAVRDAGQPGNLANGSFADIPKFGISPRDQMVKQLALVPPGQWTGDIIAANGGRHYFDAPFVALGASNFTSYYAHTLANGTPGAATNSWGFSSGALVHDQNKYIHTGGGHTDGLNSEVEYLDFANLTWVFSDDSAQLDTSADPGAPFNPSGTPPSWFPWPNKSGRRTPIACHQYGGTVYMQGTGLVQVLGAFRTPDASGGPGGAMCIDTSTGHWTTTNTSAFTALGGGQVAEWISVTQGTGNHLGRVFRLDGNPTAYLYDPSTNTWEQCGTFTNAINDFHHNGCIVPDPFNPGFSAYITVAGSSPTTQCFVASKVDVSPSPQLAFAYKSFSNTAPALTGSTWIYMGNAVNGRGSSQIVVWDGAANVSQFYILDISTYAWSGPFAISGTAPGNASAAGGQATYHRFFYHPKYDCFCWIDGATGNGGNLYAFKRPSQVV